MLRVNPFAALRPQPSLASQVASVPYDVVNTEEARVLAQGNALSFLHVVRSEIDLATDTNPYADVVYETAAKNFQKLQAEGVMIREQKPLIYLYRQEKELLGKLRSQLGVMACCHVDDYNSGIIKKHEKTRKDKEDDRTRHVLAINANAGPVFLLYKDQPSISEMMKKDASAAPLYDFTAVDGVRHTIWQVSDPAAYVAAFGKIPTAYIADGHHRSASAARAGMERRAKNPNHVGNEEYNWFLSVLFPASHLTILPYHRVIKDLNGLTPEALLEKVRAVATVKETSNPEPASTLSFGMYVAGKWYMVSLDPSSVDKSDPVGSLDYVLLSDRILTPILGIGDIRTDKRIDFVGGIRGTSELEKRVNSGDCAVAFAMHATTIEQLIQVADAGQIMPPKSTWFEPKLRSGLLVHTLD
jgi:uncharacterized protein (DUF1015 family)